MLDVIISQLDKPDDREQMLELCRKAGWGFGETLAGLGLPLTDAVEAFILHRDPIVKAMEHLIGKREAHGGSIAEAISITARIMDEALISLVAAHQECNKALAEKEDNR